MIVVVVVVVGIVVVVVVGMCVDTVVEAMTIVVRVAATSIVHNGTDIEIRRCQVRPEQLGLADVVVHGQRIGELLLL